MRYEYSDGGRDKAGFYGTVSDCVVRAIALTSGRDYGTVYREVLAFAPNMPMEGVNVWSPAFLNYMNKRGYLLIEGPNLTQHLNGRFVALTTNHVTAIVDDVNLDTFNCLNEPTLAYWQYIGSVDTNCLYLVYEDGTPISSAPMELTAAQNMIRLFRLNYKRNAYLIPVL